MTTLTRTLPPATRSETPVFHLAPAAQTQAVPAFIDRALITRLGAILDRHLDRTDTLSIRLLEEGEKFRVYSLEPPETPLPLDASLIARISQMRALLRNPLGTSILRDPWLAGDLVWEKSWLDVFRKAVAYFSREPVVAVRHEFVAETLAWIHALPPTVSPSHQMAPQMSQGIAANLLGVRGLARVRPGLSQDLIPEPPRNAQHALKILVDYLSLMDIVDLERRKDVIIRKLEAKNAILLVEIDESYATRDQDNASRDSQVTEFFVSTRRQVTELKTEHESTKKIIEKRMERAEKNLEESEQRLAKARADISSLQATVANQGAQIAYLGGRVGGLENELNNKDSSCSLM